MTSHLVSLIVRLIFSLSCLCLILSFLRRKEKQQVHRLFLSTIICLFIFASPYAITSIVVFFVRFELNLHWLEIANYLGNFVSATAIACAGANWFMLAAAYTRSPAWTHGWRRATLYLPAFLTIVLFGMSFFLRQGKELDAIISYFRLMDLLLYAFNAFFIIAAFMLYLRFVFDIKDELYRKQAFAITIGSFFPILGGIPYIIAAFLPYDSIKNSLNAIDLAQQLGLLVSILIIAYALLRKGFLNILPIALREVFHNMNDAVIVLDAQNRIVQSNEMALKIFPEISAGKPLAAYALEVANGLDNAAASPAEADPSEISLKGLIYWLRTIPLQIRDQPAGQILILTDITQRKRAEEQLAHDALHDRLTGLPNRALLIDRLSQAIKRAQREQGFKYALLFLDLDRFKRINDSLGHQAGDQLLIQVADRLSRSIRAVDTVARLGGDEFIVLLEDIDGVRAATEIALRIQESLSSPISLSGQEIRISASIGIALGAQRYHRPDDLLRDADIAMYQAKQNGKARYAVFDREMHTHVSAMLQLESDLHKAIQNQEFELHYQPIVSLDDLHILGFEALLRWRHPERGLLMPADFLYEAEEAGLMLPIGHWVLQQACSDLASWHEAFPSQPPISMSINLSRKQLLDPALLDLIREILQETNLQPSSLAFEVTESVIVPEEPLVLQALLNLKELGVQLHLDDFGTGYASLYVLPTYPIDTIKVDRSFIHKISQYKDDFEIVRTIVNLGLNLNKNVIAEGIETSEALCHLRSFGCPHGQGFFFHEPLPGEDVQHLLQNAANLEAIPDHQKPSIKA